MNLREQGAVLLISCYELGHQPLALASPLGFLERAGYAPAALDISVEEFDAGKVARARFVGISVPMHTALRLGVRVAAELRQINPACHICFYGLYATLNADYLLAHGGDSVIGGEFESALVALVEALEAGRPGSVEGVHRSGHSAPPVLERLAFAQPSRVALPRLKKYAHLETDGERRLVGYVEASRGCLHMCLHCPIPPVYGGRFFVVPREIVLEDIRRLVNDGATHITFGDPDFLNGPGHSLALVRALHGEFPTVTFDFTAKVEHILEREEIFSELRRLGCVFMISAVESLSDTVLTNLEKGHTRADVYRALRIIRDAGIAFRPTWVPFTPWTTLEDYVEMLEFVEREGLIDHVDPVQFSLRLLIPPASALLAREAIKPYLGPLDQASFSYRWTHPDRRMDCLQQEASRLVEAATASGEDPAVTFYRLKALAYATLGKPVPAASALAPDRRRAPRLTEAWFC
ncbi:MAG: B12-binding domain-containing radical SAM protein [Candidatus Rokubacteria bacterium]|nr:B12-binding domain-containing radical SAM protein [Candidatus Rokubacteria bacterium]